MDSLKEYDTVDVLFAKEVLQSKILEIWEFQSAKTFIETELTDIKIFQVNKYLNKINSIMHKSGLTDSIYDKVPIKIPELTKHIDALRNIAKCFHEFTVTTDYIRGNELYSLSCRKCRKKFKSYTEAYQIVNELKEKSGSIWWTVVDKILKDPSNLNQSGMYKLYSMNKFCDTDELFSDPDMKYKIMTNKIIKLPIMDDENLTNEVVLFEENFQNNEHN